MKLDFLSQPLVAGGPGGISCSKNQIILDVSQSYWGSSEAILRMLRRCGALVQCTFEKYNLINTLSETHPFGKYTFRKYTFGNTASENTCSENTH